MFILGTPDLNSFNFHKRFILKQNYKDEHRYKPISFLKQDIEVVCKRNEHCYSINHLNGLLSCMGVRSGEMRLHKTSIKYKCFRTRLTNLSERAQLRKKQMTPGHSRSHLPRNLLKIPKKVRK